MIADLKPYPAMKNSGVPWLGEVPRHWEVQRLGALVRERSETNNDNRVKDVLSVMRERGVIPYAEKGNVGNKKSDDITRYKIVRPDDIVVNCMNVIIGSVGLSKYTGCLSPVYYVLTPRSEIDDPRYLNAYFQTKPFQHSLVRIGNGILAHRMRIPMELLKCEPFPRPPSAEQVAIVRYLDYMDRRIRKYIRAKQKLIKLLEEQKQAIIHRAVTRGLDPSVHLKPSGVEWLGGVPEHWEMVPLRRLLSFGPKNGVSPPPSSTGRVLTMSISAVRDGCIQVVGNEKYVDIAPHTVEQFKIQSGDILLVRGNGSIDLVGKCGIVTDCRETCIYPDILMKLRPNALILPRFLVHAINSPYVSYQIRRLAKTASGIFKVSGSSVCSFQIVVPPRLEQEEILYFLEHSLLKIDLSRENARREIALLREYRTRVITDVVTGKLDVRDVAAQLPDEVDEPEPIDDVEASVDNELGDPIKEVANAE